MNALAKEVSLPKQQGHLQQCTQQYIIDICVVSYPAALNGGVIRKMSRQKPVKRKNEAKNRKICVVLMF